MKLAPAARSGALLAALGLAACTAGGHPLPGFGDPFGLGRYPGAQQQIVAYYDAHASEQGGACNKVHVDAITHSKVVTETASQLVLDLDYTYSAVRNEDSLTPKSACGGFGSRTFTFDRTGDAYKLVTMSGDSH